MAPPVCLVVVGLLAGFASGAPDNMNGEYILSKTPGSSGTESKFPKKFRDYPGGAEAFDVYSPPITTLYSQVFWTALDPVRLPEDVIKRYVNQTIAVIGFEMDQVRRTASGDVSVPITVAYNHHFESQMVGEGYQFEKIFFEGEDDPRLRELESSMGHHLPSHEWHWAVRAEDESVASSSVPGAQAFGGANGGEYRKSYHGYAPGYAQIIRSPREMQITPMQIDTWHREKMNISYPTSFVAGPLPRNSLAPEGAEYSGLLECPVTTRLRKEIEGGYSVLMRGTCENLIHSAQECFAAGPQEIDLSSEGANHTFKTQQLASPSMPRGCLASTDPNNSSIILLTFNQPSSDPGSNCGLNSGGLRGVSSDLVSLAVGVDVQGGVEITLTGPAEVWFGVGLNATMMKDLPWTIIVDGYGNVTERRLADHKPGTLLQPSFVTKSVSVQGGLRTVVLTRPNATDPSQPGHALFQQGGLIPYINAIGGSKDFAYHTAHGSNMLPLFPATDGSEACICAEQPAPFGSAKGQLVYHNTKRPQDKGQGSVGFPNKCQPKPRSDLLSMRNPTCDIRFYEGGQTSCHHMWSLLDADQEIPWADQPLTYHLKFRFWVQPYKENYHTNVLRTTWGIASPVEYDVPKCDADVDGCTRAKDGTWVHTITGTFAGQGSLTAAHFHCHAPTCLSMALYLCPEGTREGDDTCNQSNSQLLCEERPVYGGTGQIDLPKMDEPGFILQPPCLWGDEQFGLSAPPNTTNRILHAVKTANATIGHHGEMAWMQMYYHA